MDGRKDGGKALVHEPRNGQSPGGERLGKRRHHFSKQVIMSSKIAAERASWPRQ